MIVLEEKITLGNLRLTAPKEERPSSNRYKSAIVTMLSRNRKSETRVNPASEKPKFGRGVLANEVKGAREL